MPINKCRTVLDSEVCLFFIFFRISVNISIDNKALVYSLAVLKYLINTEHF